MTARYKIRNKLLFNSELARVRFIRAQNSKIKRKNKIKRVQDAIRLEKERDLELYKKMMQARTLRETDRIAVPARLSFINNTEKFISFIRILNERYESRESTYLDFENVTEVTFDALFILLSICRKFNVEDIPLDGRFSKENKQIAETIRESGFIDELFRNKKLFTDDYRLTKKLVQLRASRKVKQDLSDKLIANAAKMIWGEDRRCRGIQTACIELMQNTNNHADKKKQGAVNCWISTKYDPSLNVVRFAVLDFGVGVFESLNDKQDDSKFYGWKEKLKEIFSFENNADVLKLILEGHLHKTVTKEYYRGKGLPSLKRLLDKQHVSNLIIITNDVRGDIANNKYTLMKNSFSGTFVYWELNANNVSFPYHYNG